MAFTTFGGLNHTSLPVALVVGLAAWLLFGAFYRLYLHPLRKIPGPKFAALTWWYETYYDVIKQGQYNFKIQELHKKYGPILRINPSEIHISDREFLGEIYDARKRNKLPDASLDIESSVAGTEHYELHRKRRQAMVGFFSPKAVKQLEPLLAKKRDILLSMIDKRSTSAKQQSLEPINISDLYFGHCWDVIQEYAFAFESNVLTDPEESHKLRVNSNDLLCSVNFSRHFGWVNKLAGLLPSSIGEKMTPPGVNDLKRLAMRVRGNVDDVLRDEKTRKEDIENSTQHRSIFYTLRDEPTLPDSEKAPLRLQREGWFLVVAGSESPARSLTITHFHLLDNPDCMARLQEELRSVGPNLGLKDLEQLPYLNAVILEGNRLSFGLTRRVFRTAPEDTIVYNGYEIPPGTPFATSTLAVHADESIFPEPFAFKPDRWLGPDAKDLRKYHMSFGAKGPRSCLGVHLAEAEMRLAIAGVARYEMELYDSSVRDVEYKHDFQVAHGDLKSPGVRARVKRRVEGL